MSAKQTVPLLGRLAIQSKMITMEQLQVATREQGRDPEKRLGDIFVELGFVSAAQVEKLKKVQRDLVVKHRAKQAASGRTVPERTPPDARQVPEAPKPARPSEPPSPRPAAQPQAPAAPEQLAPPTSPAQPVASPTPASPAAKSPKAPVAKPAIQPPASAEVDPDGESLDLIVVTPEAADVEALNTILRTAVTAGASDIHDRAYCECSVDSGATRRTRSLWRDRPLL